MSAPGITYSGVLAEKGANSSGIDEGAGVFRGLKLWVSARVPNRKACVDTIEVWSNHLIAILALSRCGATADTPHRKTAAQLLSKKAVPISSSVTRRISLCLVHTHIDSFKMPLRRVLSTSKMITYAMYWPLAPVSPPSQSRKTSSPESRSQRKMTRF